MKREANGDGALVDDVNMVKPVRLACYLCLAQVLLRRLKVYRIF